MFQGKPTGKPAVSHLFERVLFKGTPQEHRKILPIVCWVVSSCFLSREPHRKTANYPKSWAEIAQYPQFVVCCFPCGCSRKTSKNRTNYPQNLGRGEPPSKNWKICIFLCFFLRGGGGGNPTGKPTDSRFGWGFPRYSRGLRHLHLLMACGIFGAVGTAQAAAYSSGQAKKQLLWWHKQTGETW